MSKHLQVAQNPKKMRAGLSNVVDNFKEHCFRAAFPICAGPDNKNGQDSSENFWVHLNGFSCSGEKLRPMSF